jgi:hypothetical protein
MIKEKVIRTVELIEQIRNELPRASKEDLLLAISIIADHEHTLRDLLTEMEIKLSEFPRK